jgi:hypothetical protein
MILRDADAGPYLTDGAHPSHGYEPASFFARLQRMAVLIHQPDDGGILVAFADTAQVPDDFTPLDDLTREQLIEVVHAYRDAMTRAGERSRAESASISAELGRILETLRGIERPQHQQSP